jgi:hypothetical protein
MNEQKNENLAIELKRAVTKRDKDWNKVLLLAKAIEEKGLDNDAKTREALNLALLKACSYAAGKEVIDALCDAGASLETRNEYDDTLLHCATTTMSLFPEERIRETIQALIARGANLEAQNKIKQTPLQKAASLKHLFESKLLIQAILSNYLDTYTEELQEELIAALRFSISNSKEAAYALCEILRGTGYDLKKIAQHLFLYKERELEFNDEGETFYWPKETHGHFANLWKIVKDWEKGIKVSIDTLEKTVTSLMTQPDFIDYSGILHNLLYRLVEKEGNIHIAAWYLEKGFGPAEPFSKDEATQIERAERAKKADQKSIIFKRIGKIISILDTCIEQANNANFLPLIFQNKTTQNFINGLKSFKKKFSDPKKLKEVLEGSSPGSMVEEFEEIVRDYTSHPENREENAYKKTIGLFSISFKEMGLASPTRYKEQKEHSQKMVSSYLQQWEEMASVESENFLPERQRTLFFKEIANFKNKEMPKLSTENCVEILEQKIGEIQCALDQAEEKKINESLNDLRHLISDVLVYDQVFNESDDKINDFSKKYKKGDLDKDPLVALKFLENEVREKVSHCASLSQGVYSVPHQ